MEKAYNKYTFVNNQEPALSAQTLNDISNAIDTIDNRVVAMGDIQGAAQEALMQAQLANAQTYENSRIAADSAEKAMSTTPTGYNQKMVQLNNLRNAPAYSSTKAYAVGDVVDYNDSIYKCKLACTNIKPTNTTYWVEVNVKTIEDDITRLNVDFTEKLYIMRLSHTAQFSAGALYRVNIPFPTKLPKAPKISVTFINQYAIQYPLIFQVESCDANGMNIAIKNMNTGAQFGSTIVMDVLVDLR